MKNNTNLPENPPAFPVKVMRNNSTDPLATPREFQLTGMTLRDWFAGRAFGLAAASHLTGCSNLCIKTLAKQSYEAADAMLAAREGV